MDSQPGSSLLIKIGDAASPEVFTTVAGLRTKSLSINSETVDVTNSDSASKMRELLAGAGIISVSASGDGVFTDAAVHATLSTKALAGGIDTYQVIVPDFGTFEGAFQLTTLEFAGEHNGEATFSMALESAGVIAFTAA